MDLKSFLSPSLLFVCQTGNQNGTKKTDGAMPSARARWCTQELSWDTPPAVLSKGLADFLQENQAREELGGPWLVGVGGDLASGWVFFFQESGDVEMLMQMKGSPKKRKERKGLQV